MNGMTGMDLKLQRVRRRVTTQQLADAGNWGSRSRISHIEALAAVPEKTARRYLDALATFPDVMTTPVEAA